MRLQVYVALNYCFYRIGSMHAHFPWTFNFFMIFLIFSSQINNFLFDFWCLKSKE